MSFQGIDTDAIVGTSTTGVQAMFPRFTFDDDSVPSVDQVAEYAAAAMSRVAREVRFKGYDPADILAADDLEFVLRWMTLVVATEIHVVLDQFKDAKSANPRLMQLDTLENQFRKAEDPFPSVSRAQRSVVGPIFPTRITRVNPSEL